MHSVFKDESLLLGSKALIGNEHIQCYDAELLCTLVDANELEERYKT